MMFSIVIPAYNAEHFIDKSVKSVLAQTYSDFELIIVDDGSIDGTKDKINLYTDARVRYIYQDNSGVSSARNMGITESKGDYICFLDSDDEWKENHLEVLFSLINEYSDCSMFVTGYVIQLNNGQIFYKSEELLKRIPVEHFSCDNGFELILKYGYFLNTNTICCKKEVFDKVGLFEVGVKNGEDDDMWFRIFTRYSIAISKKTTTIYDRTYSGATGNRVEVFEPFFISRVDKILSSPDIQQNRKDSILIWIERNKLSRVRQYLLIGNKMKALNLLIKTDFRKTSKKKYFETLLCLFIPSNLIKKHIDKRDTGYYR